MSTTEPTDEMVAAFKEAWEKADSQGTPERSRAGLRAALAVSSPSAPTEDDREVLEDRVKLAIILKTIVPKSVARNDRNADLVMRQLAHEVVDIVLSARRSPVAPSEDVATQLTGSGDVASSWPILYTTSEDVASVVDAVLEENAGTMRVNEFERAELIRRLAALRSGAAVPVETVSTVEEIDALPVGSTIDENTDQRRGFHLWKLANGDYVSVGGVRFSPHGVALPARVLFRPDREETR